ncbi:MAG: PilZ domain-containing protein [Spirochaetes bacterium]|nr:PilZ domain-containing protein [Spirochaetota bacterium]
MSIEKRQHPRVKAKLKIGYEFVKWNEKTLYKLEKPFFTEIYDISITGIGLSNLNELNKKILKNLQKGKLKIKIGIFLNEKEPPLMIFTRFIWSEQREHNQARYGLLFLDPTDEFLIDLDNFIQKHLKK